MKAIKICYFSSAGGVINAISTGNVYIELTFSIQNIRFFNVHEKISYSLMFQPESQSCYSSLDSSTLLCNLKWFCRWQYLCLELDKCV